MICVTMQPFASANEKNATNGSAKGTALGEHTSPTLPLVSKKRTMLNSEKRLSL